MREFHGRSLESFICIKCRPLFRVIILCFIDTEMRRNCILAWKSPWTEEPGGLQSMGSQRVGHDWATKHSTGLTFTSPKVLSALINKNPTETQNSWIKDLGLSSLANIWIYCDLNFKLYPQDASWNQERDIWFTFVHFQGKIAVSFKHLFKGKICSAYKYQHAVFVPHFTVFISSAQLLRRVRLFVTPWIPELQASLSTTNSQSLLKPMSIELVMPSSHLILCHPLLLLPPILPSTRVFSNESALCMRWPKYWSFSFNISVSNDYPGLISCRMDWLDLLAIKGTLKSLLQHHI